MALTLVDAYTRHLPNQPGGSDYLFLESSAALVCLALPLFTRTIRGEEVAESERRVELVTVHTDIVLYHILTLSLNVAVNDVKLAFVDSFVRKSVKCG